MRKPLDRRTFIRGTGICIALPFLEAMLPFNRSWAAEPQKFMVFYTGVGMSSEPGRAGKEFIHPAIRQILSPYNAYATYITGLINDGITNNHDELPGFMAGTKGDGYKSQTSVDRVAADLLNSGTMFKDGLFVGSQSRSGTQSNIREAMSHKKGSQSVLYHDPRTLFDLITRLGGFQPGTSPAPMPAPTPTPTPSPQRNLRQDVLSLSMDSIKKLKRELGSSDNAILDQHLTAIEQAERSLVTLNGQMQIQSAAGLCQAPSGIAASYPNGRGDLRLPILADIAAIAMNCDLTRSLAFLVFPDGSGTKPDHEHLYSSFQAKGYSRPGIGYHEWSHNRWESASDTSKSNEAQCAYATLEADKWDASIVARFLGGLNSNVLESSVVAYGSGGGYDGAHPSNGEEGAHINIPFALFGKLGGKITPKGANPINIDASVCNVWLTLLKHMGYSGTTFGTIRDPGKTVVI